METTQKQIPVTIIAPAEGKFLTQAADDIAITDRVVTDQPVYLAATDSPARWREITADEADAYREALRAEIERRDAERRLREEQERAEPPTESSDPSDESDLSDESETPVNRPSAITKTEE